MRAAAVARDQSKRAMWTVLATPLNVDAGFARRLLNERRVDWFADTVDALLNEPPLPHRHPAATVGVPVPAATG
jgi:hypothetical protein